MTTESWRNPLAPRTLYSCAISVPRSRLFSQCSPDNDPSSPRTSPLERPQALFAVETSITSPPCTSDHEGEEFVYSDPSQERLNPKRVEHFEDPPVHGSDLLPKIAFTSVPLGVREPQENVAVHNGSFQAISSSNSGIVTPVGSHTDDFQNSDSAHEYSFTVVLKALDPEESSQELHTSPQSGGSPSYHDTPCLSECEMDANTSTPNELATYSESSTTTDVSTASPWPLRLPKNSFRIQKVFPQEHSGPTVSPTRRVLPTSCKHPPVAKSNEVTSAPRKSAWRNMLRMVSNFLPLLCDCFTQSPLTDSSSKRTKSKKSFRARDRFSRSSKQGTRRFGKEDSRPIIGSFSPVSEMRKMHRDDHRSVVGTLEHSNIETIDSANGMPPCTQQDLSTTITVQEARMSVAESSPPFRPSRQVETFDQMDQDSTIGSMVVRDTHRSLFPGCVPTKESLNHSSIHIKMEMSDSSSDAVTRGQSSGSFSIPLLNHSDFSRNSTLETNHPKNQSFLGTLHSEVVATLSVETTPPCSLREPNDSFKSEMKSTYPNWERGSQTPVSTIHPERNRVRHYSFNRSTQISNTAVACSSSQPPESNASDTLRGNMHTLMNLYSGCHDPSLHSSSPLLMQSIRLAHEIHTSWLRRAHSTLSPSPIPPFQLSCCTTSSPQAVIRPHEKSTQQVVETTGQIKSLFPSAMSKGTPVLSKKRTSVSPQQPLSTQNQTFPTNNKELCSSKYACRSGNDHVAHPPCDVSNGEGSLTSTVKLRSFSEYTASKGTPLRTNFGCSAQPISILKKHNIVSSRSSPSDEIGNEHETSSHGTPQKEGKNGVALRSVRFDATSSQTSTPSVQKKTVGSVTFASEPIIIW